MAEPRVQVSLRIDVPLWEKLEEGRRKSGGSLQGYLLSVLAAGVGAEWAGEPADFSTGVVKKRPAKKAPAKTTVAAKSPLEEPIASKEHIEALEKIKKEAGLTTAAEAKRYGCRVSDCDFTAASPKARCQKHPGALKEIS